MTEAAVTWKLGSIKVGSLMNSNRAKFRLSYNMLLVKVTMLLGGRASNASFKIWYDPAVTMCPRGVM